MAKVKRVECGSCSELVIFRKNLRGKWVNVLAGSAVGGHWGYRLAIGLGIAGAILEAPIAIPAVLVGLGIGVVVGGLATAVTHKDQMPCPICGVMIEL